MPKKRPTKDVKTQNLQMVAEWKDRLQRTIDEQGVSMRRLSTMAGLGNSTVRHCLVEADDVGLATLAKLADALGTSIVYLATGMNAAVSADDGAAFKSIRALPIFTSPDLLAGRDHPEEDRGYVAIASKEYPDDIRAMYVRTRAMEPEGLNQPPPAHAVILAGDIILYSRASKPHPGDIVLATHEQIGNGLLLRRLAAAENGGWILVSNSHLYPRVTIRSDQIYARVLGIHRKTVG